MFDEDLRVRLRETAKEAEPQVESTDDEARRLAFLMAAEIRRSRQRRRVLRATGALTFLGAAAGIAIMLQTTAPSAPVAESAPARCASRATLQDATGELTGTARRDFGARFRVATIDGTRLRVDARARCAANLELASGAVDVWARGLEGGTLKVLVGDVRVEVVGTRFRVATTPEATWVHVAEGRVLVHRPRMPTTALTAGQSARFDAQGATRLSLPADVGTALAALLEDAPPATTAVVTPTSLESATDMEAQRPDAVHETVTPTPSDALVLEAEQAMRDGRLDDARALFRRAGRATTTTGEAAWIRLARLELRAGRPRDARNAIAEHDRRFRGGRLAAEALYVDSVAARALGDANAAATAERTLLERFPESAQAARVRARSPQP